jgi:hypothetical protein
MSITVFSPTPPMLTALPPRQSVDRLHQELAGRAWTEAIHHNVYPVAGGKIARPFDDRHAVAEDEILKPIPRDAFQLFQAGAIAGGT